MPEVMMGRNPRRGSGPFIPPRDTGQQRKTGTGGAQRAGVGFGPVEQQYIGVRQLPTYGSQSGGGGGDAAAPSFQTETNYDPRLENLANKVEGRLNDPEGATGRAIDRATGKIRDATEGRRKALQSMMAARGVLSGSSIPELTEGALMSEEGRNIAGASADISLGRERDNDAFMLGAVGALRAPGDAAARDRQMGADIWAQQESLRLARQRAEMDQYLSQLDMLSRLGGGL
jgi:hypothetical protein